MWQQIVKRIQRLRWKRLSESELQELMVLSLFAAQEFAESLRIALELYPDSEKLRRVATGELNTDNLRFDDFRGPGDHAEFLWHFVSKYKIASRCLPVVVRSGELYRTEIRALPAETRAMSIFSRERELPDIFRRILLAKDWSAGGLAAYRHYLGQHIVFDSQKGGHADLLAGFPVDESVAPFWKARLDLYRCIPTLFE